MLCGAGLAWRGVLGKRKGSAGARHAARRGKKEKEGRRKKGKRERKKRKEEKRKRKERKKKRGKENRNRKRKGKEVRKRFRKLEKLLGKLGGRICGVFRFLGVSVTLGTTVMARRTGRRDHDVCGIPTW
jgi:hypothetical protein